MTIPVGVVNCTRFSRSTEVVSIGRTVALTLFALVAFASNSILCRVALGRDAIDPVSFTGIRIASGAIMLWPLAWLERGRHPGRAAASPSRAGWRSGALLFAYAIAFSLAYVTLTASTGALILFPCVQVTIMIGAMIAGERLHAAEWAGLVLAIAGLVLLTLPGLSAPPLSGSLLMAIAGVAWGLYTLRGRGTPAPLSDTSRNFLAAVPLAAIAVAAGREHLHATRPGVVYASASGMLASGLGYVAWYGALRGLSAARSAMVQLAVPAIAAAGGVIFLTETIHTRLVMAAMLILGGIALALARRAH